MDEDDAWSIKVEELQRALDESKSHCQPRLMAVINPGNPTGNFNKDIRYTNNKFCYLTVITSTGVSIILTSQILQSYNLNVVTYILFDIRDILAVSEDGDY